MSVSKSWTFTKNNWHADDIAFFIEWPDFTYMVFGRETAPSTGTSHLQGYFTLKKAVRPSYLKKTLPSGTHFEIARKPELANFRYCTKSNNYTVIDRRHGRGGIPRNVTESPYSPAQPGEMDSPELIDALFEKLQPKIRFRDLYRR